MTMAPLGDADKAAVQAFLASKRGRHQLYDNVQEKMLAYVAARGITLAELPTTRPPDAAASSVKA